MPRAERAQLHLVHDPATGEVCPGCQERDVLIDELTRKLHGQASLVGRLRRDRDAEARSNSAWPVLLTLHDYWARLTGHTRTEFSPEDFRDALPRLKEWGAGNLAAGIAGIAAHPNTKELPASATAKVERYDGWDTLCKSASNVRRYIGRRPKGWSLPPELEEPARLWPAPERRA